MLPVLTYLKYATLRFSKINIFGSKVVVKASYTIAMRYSFLPGDEDGIEMVVGSIGEARGIERTAWQDDFGAVGEAALIFG